MGVVAGGRWWSRACTGGGWNVAVWVKVQVCLALSWTLPCSPGFSCRWNMALAFHLSTLPPTLLLPTRIVFRGLSPFSPVHLSVTRSRHGWPSEACPSPRRKLCISSRQHIPHSRCLSPARRHRPLRAVHPHHSSAHHPCTLCLAQAGHEVHTVEQHPLHYRYPPDQLCSPRVQLYARAVRSWHAGRRSCRNEWW